MTPFVISLDLFYLTGCVLWINLDCNSGRGAQRNVIKRHVGCTTGVIILSLKLYNPWCSRMRNAHCLCLNSSSCAYVCYSRTVHKHYLYNTAGRGI